MTAFPQKTCFLKYPRNLEKKACVSLQVYKLNGLIVTDEIL